MSVPTESMTCIMSVKAVWDQNTGSLYQSKFDFKLINKNDNVQMQFEFVHNSQIHFNPFWENVI